MKINLIPMAGEGYRFKTAGYDVPKPLIEINGLPMVVRAAKSLPLADKYIFVCRKEHLDQTNLKEILTKYFLGVVIIQVDSLTEGQANTCLLAKNYISDDAILTIGSSDNDMTYDSSSIEQMYQNDTIDGWIWTFRNNNSVLQNPNMYGWVILENNTKNAVRVSCKTPISHNPLNDHAIVGAFTFKKAKYFFDAVEAMIMANDRINNEFYVDIAINYAIQAGIQIKVCEVDQYICWGTPHDYEIYNYWLNYFKMRLLNENK